MDIRNPIQINKMRKWLILDCNYLARRALHSMGNLSHGDVKTGVTFGFLKDVENLKERFNTPHVIFCFDYGKGLRKSFFPTYKEKRHKDKTEEEIVIDKEYKFQEKKLRALYLPKLGYKNIFYQDGYEGDDIMVSVVNNLPEGDDAVMVTADRDMLQMISSHVIFYDPKQSKTISLQSYKNEFGLLPKDYWKILALAGCITDEVPGVKGVGKVTAIKYLLGQLKPSSVVYKRIRSSEGIAIRRRNIRLVKLPYRGTKQFKLRDDELSDKRWRRLADNLGFASIRDKKPLRKLVKGFGVDG